MNVLRQATGIAGRRFAASIGAVMLTALLAVPCAVFFAAIEIDAHACCNHDREQSSQPFSDVCKRLCASAASVLPPDTAPPEIPAGTSAAPCPAPVAEIRFGASCAPDAPADSPPRFVLHCAFLI